MVRLLCILALLWASLASASVPRGPLGQLTSATRTFNFRSTAAQLDHESLPALYGSGLRLTSSYDTPGLGRFLNRDPQDELGRLVTLSDLDNGGVSAWSYIGKAVGEPSKDYRYQPDALPASSTMAHSADKPVGGYRNTTLPTPASGQGGGGAGAAGGMDVASAAAWGHAYGFLDNNPYGGTEYLGLTPSWMPNWLGGPGRPLGFMGPVDMAQQWMYDYVAEPVLSLPLVSTARRAYELVAGRDLISQQRLTLGEAGENLLHAAAWDALNLGLMGISMGPAVARSAGAAARAESIEGFFTLRGQAASRALEPAFAAEGTGLARYLEGPTGLKGAAQTVQRAVGSQIGVNQTTVAIAKVRLPNGPVTYFASGSGGALRPIQRELLSKFGVPEANQFYGAGVTKGFSALENHAERIVLRNLPEGATVQEWGISWGGLQRPIPCNNCAPFVESSGGLLQY